VDGIRKQREEETREKKEQDKMLAERRIFEGKKALNEAEKEEVNDLHAGNERLSDGTTKLANSLQVLLISKGSKILDD